MDQNAKAVQYSLKVENKNAVLRIQRLLRSDLVIVDKEHYPALRSFYQLVKTEDEQQVILQPEAASRIN